MQKLSIDEWLQKVHNNEIELKDVNYQYLFEQWIQKYPTLKGIVEENKKDGGL